MRAAAGAAAARSPAKNQRNAAYSTAIATSQGTAISAPKWIRSAPATENASRLVRLDTGSSSDAELARWVHAYTLGLGRTRSRVAVSCTTGVSSTTVVSRLRTAVVTEAEAEHAPQQPDRRAPAGPGQPAACRREQALLLADMPDDQDRAQEGEHRQQAAGHGGGLVPGQRAGHDDQHRARAPRRPPSAAIWAG